MSRRVVGQFGKHTTVSVGSAAADWIMFIILNTLTGNALLAQVMARFAGGGFSFSFNQVWSFKAKNVSTLLTKSRRFILLYIFSYILSLSIFVTGAELLEISEYWAKLIADATCFVINFLVMRYYVFRDRSGLSRLFSRPLTKGFDC